MYGILSLYQRLNAVDSCCGKERMLLVKSGHHCCAAAISSNYEMKTSHDYASTRYRGFAGRTPQRRCMFDESIKHFDCGFSSIVFHQFNFGRKYLSCALIILREGLFSCFSEASTLCLKIGSIWIWLFF